MSNYSTSSCRRYYRAVNITVRYQHHNTLNFNHLLHQDVCAVNVFLMSSWLCVFSNTVYQCRCDLCLQIYRQNYHQVLHRNLKIRKLRIKQLVISITLNKLHVISLFINSENLRRFVTMKRDDSVKHTPNVKCPHKYFLNITVIWLGCQFTFTSAPFHVLIHMRLSWRTFSPFSRVTLWKIFHHTFWQVTIAFFPVCLNSLLSTHHELNRHYS
jgi:hypothetical protein